MGKYRLYEPPNLNSTAATANVPWPSDSTANTSMGGSIVLSDHCARGQHDYGYSDRCQCPCHEGRRPTW